MGGKYPTKKNLMTLKQMTAMTSNINDETDSEKPKETKDQLNHWLANRKEANPSKAKDEQNKHDNTQTQHEQLERLKPKRKEIQIFANSSYIENTSMGRRGKIANSSNRSYVDLYAQKVAAEKAKLQILAVKRIQIPTRMKKKKLLCMRQHPKGENKHDLFFFCSDKPTIKKTSK